MAELATRYDLNVLRGDLDTLRRDVEHKIDLLESKLDTMSLRLTVRMGVMLAAGLSILAAIQRLH